METLKWLSKYLKKYIVLIIVYLVLSVLTVSFNYLHPIVIGKVVDYIKLVADSGNFIFDYSILFKFISVLLIAILCKEICIYSKGFIIENVSQNILLKIRCEVFEKLEQLGCKYYDKHNSGDILTILTTDIENIKMLITSTLPTLLTNSIFLVIGFILILRINPIILFSLMIVYPFVAYLGYKLSIKVKEDFKEIREVYSNLNSVVHENIEGAKVVKAYTNENYEINKFNKVSDKRFKAQLKYVATWCKYQPSLTFFINLTNIIFLIVGGLLTITDKITVGEYATINGIIWCVVMPLESLGALANQVQQASASGTKIISVYQEIPNIQNHSILNDGQNIIGKIKFKNVSFSYNSNRVLKGLNFEVENGSTIGIIGPTGSGKSSIINLLSRFYDPEQGTIYLDDLNIKNYNIKDLRSNISVAMQDIFLFSDTIANNISYGVPDATQEMIENAAKSANIHDFIISLPDGYDTLIGEKGVGLSGGQRQRISLARALIKNPKILVLDDITSALDMETEYAIQKTLKEEYSDVTKFIIAHRISSVKSADIILVMNNGYILEWGSHEDLLKIGGYYKLIYETQFGDFSKLKNFDIDHPSESAFEMRGDK